MNRRIARRTVVLCVVMAGLAAFVWPRDWQVAGGVLGGGALIGLAAWAIRGAVDGMVSGGVSRGRPAGLLVKIFTRHAILALAAYGMMVRLHLDPVGMLAGVTVPVLAAGVESIRRVQQVS